MSNYIESLSPNLPPQEKVRLHTQRKAQENLLEEARGYGTASRAYIQAYGHLGDKGLVHDISPEYKMDAYFFILTGNNPNGDAWRRYVNVNIPSTRR